MSVSLWGLSQTAQEAVLKKCIEKVEVNSCKFTNANGDYHLLSILVNNDVDFPVHVIQSEAGRNISFLNDEQLKAYKPERFLSFKVFDIMDDSARVVFDCYYQQNDSDAKCFKSFSIKLKKIASEWEIVESNIERR